MLFADRKDAGQRLAEALRRYAGDAVVVGLPRGGVPVAREVAAALGAPLDVIVVRKIGVPTHPELAMGAVGEGGARVVDETVVRRAGVTQQDFAAVEEREREEVVRRARRFRGDCPPVSLAGRTVIVVDDGIATGSTALAACRIARARGAGTVVLAVPVGPHGVDRLFVGEADDVVCLSSPRRFGAVGRYYADFAQTSDEEVVALLAAPS
ncbi:MAG: phosphoribosyltransferase [Mycobacteriales bacterium]